MEKKRLDFRLWHWLHAFVVLGLMGTILLRKTFLSWRSNSELIMQNLSDINIVVTAGQAKDLAKAIRAPMWEWHIILGYALTALVVWRVFLFFTQSGSIKYRGFSSKSLHKKLVVFSYIGIYAIILFMTISGQILNFNSELGLSKGLVGDIKDIHELVFFYGVLIFVPLHIVGVIYAEITSESGLVSNMINGRSKQ